MLQKWLTNPSNIKDDAHETPVLTYSRELDLLVLVNSITRSDVEEESSPPYLEDVVTDSKEKTTNLEDTTSAATPQFATSSNKLNDPPMALGSTQYVLNKVS